MVVPPENACYMMHEEDEKEKESYDACGVFCLSFSDSRSAFLNLFL